MPQTLPLFPVYPLVSEKVIPSGHEENKFLDIFVSGIFRATLRVYGKVHSSRHEASRKLPDISRILSVYPERVIQSGHEDEPSSSQTFPHILISDLTRLLNRAMMHDATSTALFVLHSALFCNIKCTFLGGVKFKMYVCINL